LKSKKGIVGIVLASEIIGLTRLIFKICTFAYQPISSTQTADLNSMLTQARHSRHLLSISNYPLYNPRVKTNAGTRAFSVVAPTLWNSLPASLKLDRNILPFRPHLNILYLQCCPSSLHLHTSVNESRIVMRLRYMQNWWRCGSTNRTNI